MMILHLFLSFFKVGLLGFGGCRTAKEASQDTTADRRVDRPAAGVRPSPSPSDNGDMALMYGVPTANFQIKGKVVDSEGMPLPNIQVLRLEHAMDYTADTIYGDPDKVRDYIENTAVRTDDAGQFSIRFSGRPFDEISLQVRDVDGNDNGSFQNRIYPVKVNDNEFQDGKGWYSGKVVKEVVIQMEKR